VNRSNALFWLTVWLTAKDRGPRTGVTGAVPLSDLDFIDGDGAQDAGGGPWIAGLG
jgi:hypothetical protein